MTSANIIALFGTMLVLAAIPSVSVLTVSARAASYGFLHGVLTSCGIVLADILFILIAVYGLSFLVAGLGDWFVWVKYLGGIYVIVLGVMLFRSKAVSADGKNVLGSSFRASFMAGFLITLADQKAIFFYLGLLPAFLDLSNITIADTGMIILIATVSIMLAKLVYAYLADRVSAYYKVSKVVTLINRLAGSVMIVVGLFLFV